MRGDDLGLLNDFSVSSHGPASVVTGAGEFLAKPREFGRNSGPLALSDIGYMQNALIGQSEIALVQRVLKQTCRDLSCLKKLDREFTDKDVCCQFVHDW